MIGDVIFMLGLCVLYLAMGVYEINKVWKDATNWKEG